jgi:ABC-2 type transport system permease protein
LGLSFFTHLLFCFGFSFEFFNIPRLTSAYDILTFGTPFILSMLFPSTLAIQGFLKLNQMGADFSGVLFEYSTLWLQAILCMFLAVYVLGRKKH